MSGETRGQVSGWTVDTSHQHQIALLKEQREFLLALITEKEVRNQQRFEALDDAKAAAEKAIGTALVAQQQLVERAEAVNDRRFETFTTARRASDEASRLMMPRTEAAATFANLEQQIRQLRETMIEQVSAVRETMNTGIGGLTARADRNDGRSGGMNASWTYLIAAILGTAGLVGIIMRFVP